MQEPFPSDRKTKNQGSRYHAAALFIRRRGITILDKKMHNLKKQEKIQNKTQKKTLICFFLVIFSYFCAGHGVAISDTAAVLHPEDALRITLEDAIRLALSQNRNVVQTRGALNRTILSRIRADNNFAWQIRPLAHAGIVDGDGGAGFGLEFTKKTVYGPSFGFYPDFRGSEEDYSSEIGISFRVPLFQGRGKEVNLDEVNSVIHEISSRNRSLHQTRVNAVIDTVSAVYDILRQKENLSLNIAMVNRMEGHAQRAKIKERAGIATPLDVYRAQIRLKDAEEAVTRSAESLQNARQRLNILISFPLDQKISVSADTSLPHLDIPLEEAVRLARKNRVEILQAQADIEESKRRRRISKHNILPELDLVLGYSRFSDASRFEDAFGFSKDSYNLYFTSSTNFDRTDEKTSYRQRVIDVQNAALNYEARVSDIEREVRIRYESLVKSRERIAIWKDQIHIAQGKLMTARVKFNHGMANNFDLIEAESELMRASLNLNSVKLDYIVEGYRLRSSMGTLVEFQTIADF